jgi:hypothetical protein
MILHPSTQVPFLESRSRITAPRSSTVISAWLRETEGWASTNSLPARLPSVARLEAIFTSWAGSPAWASTRSLH